LLRIGGLSGCAFDQAAGELVAVSDNKDHPGYFTFRVTLDGDVPTLTPVAFERLDRAGAPGVLDLEGVAIAPTRPSKGRRLIVSSEGGWRAGSRVPPGLVVVEPSRLRVLPIPPQFLERPSRRSDHGVRDNAAFESLTVGTDGRLWTANETPLAQDGPAPVFGNSGRVRLLELTPHDDGWRPARQFIYRLADVPRPARFASASLIVGLVDLMPVSAERFLALERAFILPGGQPDASFNRIAIFDVSIADAEDVAARDAVLPKDAVREIAKSLVLDFDGLKGRLSAALNRLENFEALCEGPRLSDGARSVVTISDDNFNASQHTAVLLFRLDIP
jgi:hypothetical protein